MLFCVDEYWRAAYLTEKVKDRLEATIVENGMSLKIVEVTAEEPIDNFIDRIESSSAEFIVGTPFLANLVTAAAPVFTERRFIVLYGGSITPQPNIQRLAVDRTSAFHRAGSFLTAHTDWFEDQTGEKPRIMVISKSGNERRKREFMSFLDGYARRGDVTIHELAEADDSRHVIRLISEAAESLDVIVLFLSSMNTDVMRNAINSTDAVIITEGPVTDTPFAPRVAASIEEDWVEGLALAIDSRNPRITVPTNLEPGKALEIRSRELMRSFFDR